VESDGEQGNRSFQRAPVNPAISFAARVWRVAAGTLLVLWLAYVLAVTFIAQAQAWSALLTYFPPLVGPFTLVVIALPGLVLKGCHRRAAVLLATALVSAVSLPGWRSHSPRWEAQPGELRVVSCNRGQHFGHSLAPFMEQHQPDIIALQDTLGPAEVDFTDAQYAPYPHWRRMGEFTVFSKHPILHSEPVYTRIEQSYQTGHTWMQAARFLVQVGTRQVVIYNVHMLSPRQALTGQRQLAQLRGEDYWMWQQQVLDGLLQRIEAEELPVLVCGDWNLPALGPRYRRLTERLRDAHARAGSGWGFTAPGDFRHALAFWQPWLRLDYILASDDWKVLGCETENPSQAQHAAVAARLRLR
jgi:endonuclease/exonuclease/phosphatase family metal-dependent hydrolase